MKIAYLYAGQGAQHAGMGQELYEKEAAFRKAFDAGELDFDRKRICFEDPENQLIQTQFTQPCMTAVALGITDVLSENGVRQSSKNSSSSGCCAPKASPSARYRCSTSL